MSESISKKIIRNTVFNAIGRFWGIAVALFLTPYIIHHIGVERYGIWALIGVLTGYFGLLDFGIGTSFVKYIAEFYAKKDFAKINQVVNTGLVFYSVFAVFIVSLAFFLINPLIALFKIPTYLSDEALFVFLLGIILFCVSNAVSAVSSIPLGLQRMDVSNKIAIAVSILMVGGTIYFLEKGYGLPGLMVNNAIILIIGAFINFIVAFKILPELKLSFGFVSKGMFKKLFGFGYKLQFSKIAILLHFHLDKILLACFLNIGFVAYYSIAASLAAKLREFPLMLMSAILPAASELSAKMDGEGIEKLYFRLLKYIVLVALPLSSLAIFMSGQFINLWLGPGYKISILTTQFLVFGYFFSMLSGPGFIILNGIGKPQYGMKSSILAATLNLVLSVVLIIKMGYYGTVFGTVMALIIAAVYFISLFHKTTQISFSKIFLKVFLKPIFANLISFIIMRGIIGSMKHISWEYLIGFGCVYFLIFVLILIMTGYLDNFDKVLANRYTHMRLFNSGEANRL